MKLLIRMLVSTLLIIAIGMVIWPTLGCGCSPIPEPTSVASLRADLRDLASAEQVYRKGHGKYAASLAELAFNPSNGRPFEIVVSSDGFYAWRHDWAGRWRCMIVVGSFVGDSLRDGEPRCQQQGKPLRPLPARRR